MKKMLYSAALSAALPFGLLAATNEIVELPPVIVEASRLGKSAKEIPAHVDVITRGEIESSGAQSTVELLEKRANLFLRKINANPALAQVSMRGYGANGFGRVKILVDGEELNNPDMEAQDLLRVPVRSVERVEVLHGPQTVLHGGDASAGVINIITDADSYERKTVLEVHGGSWETIGTHAGTRGGFEDEGITYFADVDWDRSDGWRQNSQYEIWSAKGGVKKRFENDSWFSVKTFYADSQYGLPGGLYDGSYYGVDYGDWKRRARTADDRSSHARNGVYGLNLAGSFVVAEDQWLDSSFAARHRTNDGYGEYNIYTYAYSLKYRNENRLFGFGNKFALGTDLKYDDVGTDFDTKNVYSRFTGALFAQDEFFVLDELSLIGGVRGEGFSSRDRFRGSGVRASDAQDSGRVAGDVGLNYRPVEKVKLFARWSRFYHAPLADEMFSTYGVPNMNLVPEVGHTTEVGADWDFLDDWNVALTLFHTELSDEIMYYNYANANAPDDTRRDGLETSLGWSRDKVGSAAILYTLTDARFSDGVYDENLIPLVPRQQIRVFGEVYLWDECAVHGGYRFVGRQRWGSDFANDGGMMSDYGIFDVGVRYMPENWHLKGLTLAFTIDNLFDRRYADYGEWFGAHYVYPAAGRCYMFSVKYEF